MLSLESEQVPIAFAVVEGGGGPGGRVAISVGRPEIPVGTGQPVLTEAPGQMNEGLVEGSSPRVSSSYGVRVSFAAFGLSHKTRTNERMNE